ncbi:MAG: helix-turn-helix transcriptional regulator [Actinobacteria bacterium]|nr:helix-turn-helix transcriptional regulator [Actinomycetota bacterium]
MGQQEQRDPQQQQRGVLYPRNLPEFHRYTPAAHLAHAVRWFWIPEWRLDAGERSVQRVLPFPACNLAIEANGIAFVGPPTRRSERVLEGAGWCVGALLRPAAANALAAGLGRKLDELHDSALQLDDTPLLHEIVDAMTSADLAPDARHERAMVTLGTWLSARVPQPETGSDAALANKLEEVLADPTLIRADQLAPMLHTSPRTLQRLAERYFGLSLHSMIRRRRLQEGAARLREQPNLSIAALATELGYADHAHFTKDFKALLGVTPSAYRGSATE